MIILTLIFYFCFANIFALKDISKLNIVKVDLADVSYKVLMVSENGTLSIPPLVVLDVKKLKSYQCFENIRTNRWSLGIPIVFWNQTYMDKVTKSISSLEFFQKFKTNVSEQILPPSGILAYRLNWRRRYEIYSTNIKIDTFWYNCAVDYVLPKYHTFIIEFKPANDSESNCAEVRNKILNESLQSQELTVDFVVRKSKKVVIPQGEISIGEVKRSKMFKDSKCDGKEKCLVSFEYAEKWAYEISANALRKYNVIHLSLQKDIYENILNNFLCKDKVSISDLEIIKKLTSSTQEMGCKVPETVYTISTKVCKNVQKYNNGYDIYGNRNFQTEVQCTQQAVNYDHEVILRMNDNFLQNERNEFSLPVKRS